VLALVNADRACNHVTEAWRVRVCHLSPKGNAMLGICKSARSVTAWPTLCALPLSAALQVIVPLPLASVVTSDTTTVMFAAEYAVTTVDAAPRMLVIVGPSMLVYCEAISATVRAASVDLYSTERPSPNSTLPAI